MPAARRLQWFLVGTLLSFGMCIFGARAAKAQNARFEANSGEVYDRKTGLTWQRCSAGQTWSGGRCAGAARQFTFDSAQQLMGNGWRLPTREELSSLVNDSVRPRRIADSGAFPDMPTRGILRYWTAEATTGCIDNHQAGCAMIVNFGIGGEVYYENPGRPVGNAPAKLIEVCAYDLICVAPRNYPSFVRLVRVDRTAPAAQTAASTPPAFTSATGRFVVQGNEVLDRRTGLLWQRCPSAGQTYQQGIGCAGIVREYSREEMLHAAGSGWRLPTKDEMLSLIDEGRRRQGNAPYIDVTAFPEIRRDRDTYWTGTIYTNSSPDGVQYWCVNFGIGTPQNCGKYPVMLRLVRDRRLRKTTPSKYAGDWCPFMTFLFCLLLAAAGLILFLLSVWWEHDFSKRAAGSLSDGKVDDRTLEDLQREHKIIEWVRVAGAIGLLIGLVLPMFVGR